MKKRSKGLQDNVKVKRRKRGKGRRDIGPGSSGSRPALDNIGVTPLERADGRTRLPLHETGHPFWGEEVPPAEEVEDPSVSPEMQSADAIALHMHGDRSLLEIGPRDAVLVFHGYRGEHGVVQVAISHVGRDDVPPRTPEQLQARGLADIAQRACTDPEVFPHVERSYQDLQASRTEEVGWTDDTGDGDQGGEGQED